ncbi:MAG: YegP family protein, partial [Bacteroidota bacterium]
FYFQFLKDDESPLLNSQGYTTKEARNNGLRSVIENAQNESILAAAQDLKKEVDLMKQEVLEDQKTDSTLIQQVKDSIR